VTDIAAEVRDILVLHLGTNETMITPSVRLVEDLGVDSVDLFEVVVACEEKFNIDIPNDAVMEFVTVGDAVEYIKAKLYGPKVGLLHAVTKS
jgi:acyl carrier protein